ncbi:MAG: dihydrofolate reductase family protein [Proteobacteria bacterium]|nr:dihydrofolate reductase family protein [Pseudomonadota bacterium]
MNSELVLGKLIPEPKLWEPLTIPEAMKLAIQEAFRGSGFVSPNPLVGCVVLDRENRFLASGYHHRWGSDHAEIDALKKIEPKLLHGAKFIVTLEPCAHEGKTPSCAKTLAKLPLSEVVFGLVDPNPLVSGQGAEILKSSGIQVSAFEDHPKVPHFFKNNSAWTPERQKEWVRRLEQTCEHFLFNFRQKQTFISLKVASSWDGFLGLQSGESRWITGPEARGLAHHLRAFHEGLMVGAQTVLIDNPSLDIRAPGYEQKKNKIIILDGRCQTLLKVSELQVFQKHSPDDLWIFVSEAHWQAQLTSGALSKEKLNLLCRVIPLPEEQGRLSINAICQKLWEMGLKSCMVEGGALVLSSFISARKAQRLYLFQAPVLLGGSSGISWSSTVRIRDMSHKIVLNNQRFITCGQDLLLTGEFSG